ncbi:MAG: DUF1549 domain-containing protein, partial [Planctomycetaceae bacterium]
MNRFCTLWSCGICLILTLGSMAGGAEKIDFARDIRPILSDNCFQCHGPDAAQRKTDLRLDTRDGLLSETDGTIPVIPRNAGESELFTRLVSTDESQVMPPPKSGKKLTARQIELVRQWIDQGAEYGGHWAFTAPRRAEPPEVRSFAWVRNPVDRFVAARLEREGLQPAPEADRVTLIRRLSLDLIGLPPTTAEVDTFVFDKSPYAYENLVRRLLMSPHYGERWARLWLDAARYADSDGFEKDKSRQVWAYRDWVINAFNRDLPYDQFVIEQIAGDLLPGATQDQRVATGFLRNSMINEEGGVDPEQFRMEAMFDRMDAIGKSMLGLTIQCAQCHNHKYDPLTQEDYYKVFAFLNNDHEANIAVYAAADLQQRAELLRQIAQIEQKLQHDHSDWKEKLAAWEAQVKGNQPPWEIVKPELDASGGQKHYVLDDGSILAAGYAPTKHTTEFTITTKTPRIAALRLELLNDPNLPLGGPGRSIKGLFALTEFRATAAPADKPDQKTDLKFANATADVNPAEVELASIFYDKTDKRRVTGPLEYALDGKDETAWGIDIGPGRSNVPRNAVFPLEQPIENAAGWVITYRFTQNHGGWNSDDNQNNNLGRFRLSLTNAGQAAADTVPPAVRAILSVPAMARSPAQIVAVFSHWRTTVPEWKAANEQIEALWRQHPEGSSQLVLSGRETPRDTRMLERGDFLKPGRPIGAGVPGFLNPLPANAPANRLTFGRWLASRDSPTAARSIVNRIWQAYFGLGIVTTSEDLGSQSDAPSHPELLDWLAVELMDRGWSLKELHRLIVTSATYRQSSKVTPELAARDPLNRLLARGPRFRVDAEIVRDVALAASGLLNDTVGGSSVFPPAPEFLFQPPASYGPKIWKEDRGDNRYRRALYTFRFRSVPYPALQAFDAPNGDFSCVRRTRSNTPLQALTGLNEPLFLECARALAQRTLREGGASNADRLVFAFRSCVARLPAVREQELLLRLLDKETTHFSAAEATPWNLAANDPTNPPTLPAGVTPAQAAAWTVVSRVLLNLDETISK